MNTPKQKPWVNSMFSQLSHLESNNRSLKRKKFKEDIPNPSKRITRQTSTALQQLSQNINIETEADCNKTSKNLMETVESGMQSICNENWIDFFAPSNSQELAVHPKKIQELQQWFDHCAAIRSKNPAQLCLLTGPSGCGKTAAVRILAKENNFNIQEWINPVDQEIVYNLGDQQTSGQSYVGSQVDAFKNFLFQASRYRSLFDINTKNKCLLLVEDFPNFLLRDSSLFEEIIDNYVNYAKSPIIFIVTDAKTRGLNISYNIFTDQVRQKFLINHISFNAVASTIMQKSMKRFCLLMRSLAKQQVYTLPPADTIDSILISAQGDIRNALINLHFSSLIGAPNMFKNIVKNKKRPSKKVNGEHNKLKSLTRDESVSIMHALGRIFNPKFTEYKRFVHSPEDITEAFSTEPKKFIDLVHTNYIMHFREIECVLEASDGLSMSDLMLNEYRDDSVTLIGLNAGIRSVMVANRIPATGWLPIKGQKRIDQSRTKLLPQECKVLPDHHNISSSLYTLDYKTFVKIISP